MKKCVPPELTRTINRQAHKLAMLSAASIRQRLEEQARIMLNAGKSLDDTLTAIRTAGQAEVIGKH